MGRVEDEVVVVGQARGHGAEQVRREVEHGSAPPARCVEVHALRADEVVSGPAMADVDVLDDPEPGQRFEGPVHAGTVHGRVLLGDRPDHVLGQDVSGMRGEGVDHGTSGPRHPFAPGTQYLRDLDLHVRPFDEHSPSVPGARHGNTPDGKRTRAPCRPAPTTPTRRPGAAAPSDERREVVVQQLREHRMDELRGAVGRVAR